MHSFDIWFSLALFLVDFLAAAAMASALWMGYGSDSTCKKIGMSIAFVGVVFQACQFALIIVTRELPAYTDMPLWSFKDIGLAVLSVGIARYYLATRHGIYIFWRSR